MADEHITKEFCDLRHKEIDDMKEDQKNTNSKLDKLIMINFGCFVTIALNAVILYLRAK